MRRPAKCPTLATLTDAPRFGGVPEVVFWGEIGIGAVLWLLSGLHFEFLMVLGLLALGVHPLLVSLSKRDSRLVLLRLTAFLSSRSRYGAISRLVGMGCFFVLFTGCGRGEIGRGALELLWPVPLVLGGILFAHAWRRRRRFETGTDSLLPWRALLTGGVILTKDEGWMAVWRLAGPDPSSREDDELTRLRDAVARLVQSAGPRWSFHVEQVVRGRKGQRPSRTFDGTTTAALRDVLEARDDAVRGRIFVGTETFLSATYQPEGDLEAALGEFEDLAGHLEKRLPELRPRRCRGTGLLEFLSGALLQTAPALPPGERALGLDQALAVPVEAGSGGFVLDGSWVAVTLTLTGYPPEIYLGLFDGLAKHPVRLRFSSVIQALAEEEIRRHLEEHRRAWGRRAIGFGTMLRRHVGLSEKKTDEQGRDLEGNLHSDAVMCGVREALEGLEAGRAEYVLTGQVITVYARSEREANATMASIRGELERRGVTSYRDAPTTLLTWRSFLPGASPSGLHLRFRPLPAAVGVLPITGRWQGAERLGFAALPAEMPPLLEGTVSGTDLSFGFTPFLGDVGHHVVMGPTGSGKSTLLNAEALAFAGIPGARVIVFDYGQSARGPAELAGGTYFDVDADGFSLHPFEKLEEPTGFLHARELLEATVALNLDQVTTGDRGQLVEALEALRAEPAARRSLARLVDLVQDRRLQEALRDYRADGPLGGLLDATQSTLSGSPDYLVIETEGLFRLPERFALPALQALLHRVTETLADKVPTLVLLDEVWMLLKHPIFRRLIPDWLATLRKRNAAVGLATQSPAQLVSDPAFFGILRQSCPTSLFLPDPNALSHSAPYEEMGLGRRELEILAAAEPKKDYYLTGPRGSALVDFHFNEAMLAALSGRRGVAPAVEKPDAI